MRAERPTARGKPHRNRRGVPARRGKPVEHRVLGGLFVEMERLRIEFGGKTQDVFFRHRDLIAFKFHADLQVVEPFNHA